jgi:hypothetical protein
MATSRTPSTDPSPFSRPSSTDDTGDLHDRIARAAYRRAQARGFEPGHELDDWLEAEQEVAASEREPPNEPH